jgi:hypothetical protein
MANWNNKIKSIIKKFIPGMEDIEEASLINRSYKRYKDDATTYKVIAINNGYASFETGELVRVDILKGKFIDVTDQAINESSNKNKKKDMSVHIEESHASSTLITEDGRHIPEEVVRQQEYAKEQARLRAEEDEYKKKMAASKPADPLAGQKWTDDDDDDIDIYAEAAAAVPAPPAAPQARPIQPVRAVVQEVPAPVQVSPEIAIFNRVKRLNDFKLNFSYDIKVPAEDQLKMLDTMFELSYIDYLADDLVNEITQDPTQFKEMIKEQITNHFYKKKPARRRAPAKGKAPARSRAKKPKSE